MPALGEDHAPSGTQSVMTNELHVIRSVKLFCTVMPAAFREHQRLLAHWARRGWHHRSDLP
jgi:hypothetical protein